jgi:diacylglycerol kinase (ATP)
MPDLDRSLLLVNAKARRGDIDVEEIADRLSSLGPVLVPVCPAAEMLRSAILEHADAVRRVLICGGDGTLNCALPALLSTGLPLGVLPCGTANDFARSLGIKDLDAGIESAIAGHVRAVDVGVVNGSYFLNAAGIGLGPEINKNLGKAAKSRFGVLEYFLQALRQARGHRGMRLVLDCDGEQVSLRSMQLTIANGVHYGGGMTISDDARLDDGRLDVLCIRPQSLLRLLGYGLSMRSGRLVDDENIRTFSCRRVTVTTRHAADVTADGELVTRTPAECHVRSRALKVFVPVQ